ATPRGHTGSRHAKLGMTRTKVAHERVGIETEDHDLARLTRNGPPHGFEAVLRPPVQRAVVGHHDRSDRARREEGHGVGCRARTIDPRDASITEVEQGVTPAPQLLTLGRAEPELRPHDEVLGNAALYRSQIEALTIVDDDG